MPVDLLAQLPSLLPEAVAWAQRWADRVAATGCPLDEPGLRLARQVGVAHPERIRVLEVDAMPQPNHPALRMAVEQLDFLSDDTAGLTLGHSILLRRGCASARLLSHECRHVHQVEQAGSLAAFLTAYLQQVLVHGYFDAPFEADARAHELEC